MPAKLDDLIRAQFGVIARGQALALGMSSGGIQARLTRRDWFPVHAGVYLQRTHPQSPEAETWAAMLATPGAVLTGVSAAWWWGLTDQQPGHVELTVSSSRHLQDRRGVVIVRRELDPLDVARHRGLVVTAKPLSALRAAVALGPKGAALLDRALQRSVRFADVRDAYWRQLGCVGSPRAGQLIRAAGDRAAAESERLLIRDLRAEKVTGWSVNIPITLPDGQVYIPDIAFRAAKVLIEVDGWAWHHSPDRFAADRRRQNALILLGWTVLRFTWFDLTERPRTVIGQIRRALGGS